MILLAALLGAVQGLTEFLPVSSSAHLILARAFFGWDTGRSFGLAFDVATHVGTLAAILYYFRADLGPLIAATPAGLLGRGGERGHMVRLLVAGTIPIVILGLLGSDWLETLREPAICAVMLTVGSLGMLAAERFRSPDPAHRRITLVEAFAIGCGQAAALFPGMSRSGTTITVAMFMGIRRDEAARFTFLMSIPAVIAAAVKEALDVGTLGIDAFGWMLFVVGAVVAGVIGYLSIKYLIRYLASHSLDPFAYYRLALAGAVVVWLVRRAEG